MCVTSDLDFEEFYAATRPRLLRTTFAVTRDEQRAEDAVQVAFINAYTSWRRVSRADDPVAYVRRIAINAALAQHRSPSWRRENPSACELTDEPVTDASEGAAQRLDLWHAIGTLPPRQRAVMVLRYYEDLSETQIAIVLGIRPGTVKSQAAAALATLRRHAGTPRLEGGRA